MNDRPLDPATLDALRAALAAHDPLQLEPGAWTAMLRRTFEAGRDDELHGGLSGRELLPLDWPSTDPTAPDDAGTGSAASFDTRAWADVEPGGVLDDLAGGLGADDDGGGDLT